ncbi:MAG: OmpA family protein [Microbacterium sp.]|jgi:OOP family OmpA-OmpF porin|nr:OmpA family protein [Microbacterium sp.]
MNADRTARAWGALLLATSLTLPLAACAAEVQQPASTTSPSADKPATDAPSPSASASADAAAAIAGYAPGEIPPIPALVIPSIAMADEALAGVATRFASDIPQIPGIRIAPAACGDAVARATAGGVMVLNGDGSGSVSGDGGTTVNNGDGSGSFTVGDGVGVVNGDGSGSFSGGDITIVSNGDGSGSYSDANLTVVVNGDGSGSSSDAKLGTTLVNNGDGSGSFSTETTTIVNNGDGSGSYGDGEHTVVNHGDGTGIFDGATIDMEPLAKAAPVGLFPSMGALAPIEYCGTTITLEDGVLFDFDRSDIRPDAATTMDALASALTTLSVPAAEVGGHTDAIGEDAYNLTLSDARAQSVVAALQQRGVATSFTAVGYGESAPVAPNEINGADNPEGRQLNRRVEIFVPAF